MPYHATKGVLYCAWCFGVDMLCLVYVLSQAVFISKASPRRHTQQDRALCQQVQCFFFVIYLYLSMFPCLPWVGVVCSFSCRGVYNCFISWMNACHDLLLDYKCKKQVLAGFVCVLYNYNHLHFLRWAGLTIHGQSNVHERLPCSSHVFIFRYMC